MKRTRPKDDQEAGWVRISWEEALSTIAAKLKDVKAKYGPESVVFCAAAPGGSPSRDYRPWVMRLANLFGSPNFVSTTHICNWHKDVGSRYTYGFSIPEPDFKRAACILIWGHNPSSSWPTHYRDIVAAKSRGAKLIVVDPRLTEVASKADVWLQVRPGADGALALSMLNVVIKESLYDVKFVKDWTNGPLLVRSDNGKFLRQSDLAINGDPKKYMVWDVEANGPKAYDTLTCTYEEPQVNPAITGTYRVTLANGAEVECKPAFQLLSDLASKYEPEKAQEVTWVSADDVREAARMFATVKPACYYTYSGIEQHTNAAQTNRAICVLYALTGNLDAPGGNVVHPELPLNPVDGKGFLPPEIAKRRLGLSERPLGPARFGYVQAYEVYKALLTGKPYPIKALVSFGGNLVMSNGDSLRAREALKRLEFFAQVDLFQTPTADLADILLPAATPWESIHVGIWEPPDHVQLRQEVVPPLYECWPDMKIIFELAKRLGFSDKFWNGDIEAAFNYQLAPLGITVDDLKDNPGGISIPQAIRYRKYMEKDPETGGYVGFPTPTRRVELYSEVFKEHGYDPLPVYREPYISPFSRPDIAQKYPLILTTAKVLQFCHSQHRAAPTLRKQVPHPYLEINPKTAEERGIKDGDWVILETMYGSIKLMARVTDKIHPRVVCTQHGWWQACPQLNLPGYDPFSSEGANVNLLISNDAIDPISGSVPHKSYLCDVRKWAN
jgi:anaerobic selenocysteine-containing dehydrogenase